MHDVTASVILVADWPSSGCVGVWRVKHLPIQFWQHFFTFFFYGGGTNSERILHLAQSPHFEQINKMQWIFVISFWNEPNRSWKVKMNGIRLRNYMTREILIRLLLFVYFLYLEFKKPFIRLIQPEEWWLYKFPRKVSLGDTAGPWDKFWKV